MKNVLCIYHGHCIDGWGSATALKMAIPNAEFHAGIYNDPCPDVSGKNVYLVDFSYKREVIEDMLTKALSVTIIDHHKSAISDLEGLVHPNLVKCFASQNSGAVLTWKFFFPSKPIPDILRHIEDRDLWTKALPDTDIICAALYSHDFDFDTWAEFYVSVDSLIYDGKALMRSRNKAIKEVLLHVPEMVEIGGHIVPCMNVSPSIKSEVGQGLCELNPDHFFSATYADSNGHRVFSLRSTNGFDVSEIAFSYGGGGHKAAAGFRIPLRPMGTIRS